MLIFTLSSAFMFHLYLPPAPAEWVAMAAACCLSTAALLLLSALIFHKMFAARGLQVSMITKENVAFSRCSVCIPPQQNWVECSRLHFGTSVAAVFISLLELQCVFPM